MRRSPLRADIVVWFEWVDRDRPQLMSNSVHLFPSVPSCVMTMDVDRAGQIEEFFGGVENPDVSMTGEPINQRRHSDRSSLPSKATRLPQAATSSQPKGKGKGQQRRQFQQSDQSTEELKHTIRLMARAVVRHEDAIQTLRLDTGFVWFAQLGDGKPDTTSIIPFSRSVAQKWHGKENSEMSSRPLREVMFMGILQKLLAKFGRGLQRSGRSTSLPASGVAHDRAEMGLPKVVQGNTRLDSGQDQNSSAAPYSGHIVEEHASDGGRASRATSVLLHSQAGSVRDRSCSIRAGSLCSGSQRYPSIPGPSRLSGQHGMAAHRGTTQTGEPAAGSSGTGNPHAYDAGLAIP